MKVPPRSASGQGARSRLGDQPRRLGRQQPERLARRVAQHARQEPARRVDRDPHVDGTVLDEALAVQRGVQGGVLQKRDRGELHETVRVGRRRRALGESLGSECGADADQLGGVCVRGQGHRRRRARARAHPLCNEPPNGARPIGARRADIAFHDAPRPAGSRQHRPVDAELRGDPACPRARGRPASRRAWRRHGDRCPDRVVRRGRRIGVRRGAGARSPGGHDLARREHVAEQRADRYLHAGRG